MTKFELEIRYPQHLNASDAEKYGALTADDILSRFDAVQWRRMQMQQLRMEGSSTSFMVTDVPSQQNLRLTMNAYASSDQLEFKLESDVEIITPQRELFGLFTRQNKDYVGFKKISHALARQYLQNFLNEQLDSLKNAYQQSLKKG